MSNLPEAILSAIQEALSLWKTFIETRQQAYNRKMDKRKNVAIATAEEVFEKINVLYDFIYQYVEIPTNRKAEFDRIKILIYRLKTKFNKYD